MRAVGCRRSNDRDRRFDDRLRISGGGGGHARIREWRGLGEHLARWNGHYTGRPLAFTWCRPASPKNPERRRHRSRVGPAADKPAATRSLLGWRQPPLSAGDSAAATARSAARIVDNATERLGEGAGMDAVNACWLRRLATASSPSLWRRWSAAGATGECPSTMRHPEQGRNRYRVTPKTETAPAADIIAAAGQ